MSRSIRAGRALRHVVAGTLLPLALAAPAATAEPATASSTGSAPRPPRDGAHDFDFNVGTWRTEIHHVLDPLRGSAHAVDLRGTVTVHPLWNGRGYVEEIDAEGDGGRMQGMTLFLYDPSARQWGQTYASSAGGRLTGTLVGAFDGGRGVLVANDTVDGRAILVRAVWSDITADAHRFEESFSDDGGVTWTPALTARLTRVRS